MAAPHITVPTAAMAATADQIPMDIPQITTIPLEDITGTAKNEATERFSITIHPAEREVILYAIQAADIPIIMLLEGFPDTAASTSGKRRSSGSFRSCRSFAMKGLFCFGSGIDGSDYGSGINVQNITSSGNNQAECSIVRHTVTDDGIEVHFKSGIVAIHEYL